MLRYVQAWLYRPEARQLCQLCEDDQHLVWLQRHGGSRSLCQNQGAGKLSGHTISLARRTAR